MHPTKKKLQPSHRKDPGHLLEMIMAVIVFIAILIGIVALWEPFTEYIAHRTEHHAFLTFIGEVFSVVIGIEFFKLLCKPGKDTLLEVLMFVVARHMIIEETSPMDNLISILSILVLFVADKFFLSKHSFSEESDENDNDME